MERLLPVSMEYQPSSEYGVPAVINVPGVLSIIKDGQTIEVDGTNGRVYLDLNNADGVSSLASGSGASHSLN